MTIVKLEDFIDDQPWTPGAEARQTFSIPDQIEGVVVQPLVGRRDGRGELVELLTSRGADIEPMVHAYQVFAEPGSIRSWVYHKRQSDRLAYTSGRFKVALFDLRPQSPTYLKLNVIEVGEAFPCLVTIPPYVVHGVQNTGTALASFVNLPTRAYDPANPDKSRLPYGHPGIPNAFD